MRSNRPTTGPKGIVPPSPDSLSELLLPYKVGEVDHRALLLADDRDAMVVAIGWVSNFQGRNIWVRPEGDPPDDMAQRWDWLASGITVDTEDFAERVGLPKMVADQKLGMLVSNKLLYPDGTAARAVVRLLDRAYLNAAGLYDQPVPESPPPVPTSSRRRPPLKTS